MLTDLSEPDSKSFLTMAKAELNIEFSSSQAASVVLSALEPETKEVASERATTTAVQKENGIHLIIEAQDLTALRASMNSFLAWISSCQRTLEVLTNDK